jgi:hypothetical protein
MCGAGSKLRRGGRRLQGQLLAANENSNAEALEITFSNVLLQPPPRLARPAHRQRGGPSQGGAALGSSRCHRSRGPPAAAARFVRDPGRARSPSHGC